MSVCLQNIRELCDENLDMVMKVERCRKAILEDVENLMPHSEPIYRQLPPHPNQHHQYGKNMQVPLFGPNNYAYMQNTIQQQMLCNANLTPYGTQRFPKNQQNINQKVMQRNTGAQASHFQKNNGYQLKVGGVVVGSWSNGSKNQPARMNNRNGMIRYPINQKFAKATGNRYRPGAPGTLATLNQKSTNRFANKKKSPKPKKDANKADEENVEKKTILKDEKKDATDSSEQPKTSDDTAPSDDNQPTTDEKTNGCVEVTDESCDKKDDKTAASDGVAFVDTEQQQPNAKNGKANNTNNSKKNKKNAKAKVDSQVGEENVGEVKA